MMPTLALVALASIDVIQTEEALDNGLKEANPIVKRLMARLGRMWWVPKIAGTALIGGFLEAGGYSRTLAGLAFLQALVIVWNAWKMVRRKRK